MKNRKQSIWKFFVAVLILSQIILATEGLKTEKVGFVGAQFIKIEVGARGFALGGAMEPISDDASAVFWNPAGLTQGPDKSFFSTKTSWLAGIDHTAAAFSMKVPYVRGYLAVSLVGLTTDDMLVTTSGDQDGSLGNRTFSVGNYALGLGYALSITNKFSFGIHAKYIDEEFTRGLQDVTDGYGAGSTWAVDVGTLYLTGYKTMKIGMSIRNFGPDVQLGGTYIDYDDGEPILDDDDQPVENQFKPYGLPLTFKFGISADPIVNETQKLTISVVGEHPSDNSERLNVGAEYTFQKYFVGRAGYVFNHDTKGASAGIGINAFPIANIGKVNIDLAITDFSLFDPVWMASLGIQF
jgi:hypothetical protein